MNIIKDLNSVRYTEFEREWTEITKVLFYRLGIQANEKLATIEFEGGERDFFKVDGVYVQKLGQYCGSKWIEQYYISDINC